MEENQSAADKPHEATPRKLEEARRKGEIVRSADLNAAVVYGGFLLAGALLAPWFAETLGNLTHSALGRANELAPMLVGPGSFAPSMGLIGPTLVASAAVAIVPAFLLIVALVAQQGFLFTPSKLAPKLNRISPLENAKQKFGAQGLFQFAKSAAKLILVCVFLALFLWARSEEILATIYATPGQLLEVLGALAFDFMIVVVGMMATIGGIEWLWEWSQLLQRNRMSRQELVDETKSNEGDPHMKQQRRQRGQSIAMNQMLSDVPGADVVVVNPTHYAVALKWDRLGGGVPICVAKGVDEVARKIREAAAEAGVPIYSDPPTARALHASVDLGNPILPDQYKAVAAAIRFADVMRLRAKKFRR